MKDIEKEVVDVLTESTNTIGFEELQSEQNSPLNQAVKEKNVGEVTPSNNWNIWKPEPHNKDSDIEYPEVSGEQNKENFASDFNMQEPPLDAPEQEIGGNTTANTKENTTTSGEEEFELPTATAKQAADTLLGMTNNVLGVGGGFFVKIQKHKDFYAFEEIVELIDEQNDKNVQRIKLDKEDKTLLKPLIVAILKKKAKKLTPEQQLTGAVLSILIKKVQVVMEVRAENEILFDRILNIVQEEKAGSNPNGTQQESDTDILSTEDTKTYQTPEPNEKEEVIEPYEELLEKDSAYSPEPIETKNSMETIEVAS